MSNLLNLPPAESLPVRRTTPDHVADALREAILTGRLQDGAELNQVVLADHFSVSRVPVREALRQLQAEGLVKHVAHKRAVVTTLSYERIMELFDLRVLMETYMLERAIDRIDEETLDALDECIDAMDGIEDLRAWLDANRRFHRLLYTPAGALYTLDMAEQFAARTARYLYMRSGGEGIGRRGAHREHVAILAAARSGDVKGAVRELTGHIEGTRERVQAFLAEREAAQVDEP